MSERKMIRIVIDPKGNQKIEAIGYVGGECAEATRAFTAGLLDRQDAPKPEMYQQAEQGQQITLGG